MANNDGDPINQEGEDVSFNSNDSTLSDIDTSENLSIFDPGGTGTILDDSHSSLDMKELYNDEDDDEDDDEHSDDLNQTKSQYEASVLRQTSTELYEITKLLQLEFAKNPLSTQQILTREVGGIYKKYAEHGSYLRLSENIMNFLQKGQTAARPTTKKHTVKYKVRDVQTREEKLMEKEVLVNDLDRIQMAFAVIPKQHKKVSTGSDELDTVTKSPFSAQQAQVGTQQQDRYSDNAFGASTISVVSDRPSGFNRDHKQPSQNAHGAVRIKLIKDLLPVEVPLNHNHPYTMTVDPEGHKILDPNHPEAVPFNPLTTEFSMPRGTNFAAGSLQALNNIFLLTSLNAQHTLNWLQIKYTPLATASCPNPPAPPFALFRLGIQQFVQSNLNTCFNAGRAEPLGLTPQARALLKDLHTNHQRGRGGMNSLQSYYSISEELRNDSWLTGSEHITTPSTTILPVTGEAAVGAGTRTTSTTRVAPNSNPGGLNHVERRILERATGVIIPRTFENWWNEASDEKRAWGWLRKWIRETEVKRVLEAKRDGRF